MFKRALIIFLLLTMFTMTGCSNNTNSIKPVATETPTKDPTLIEQFHEDKKVGLRKGNTIIADAVWDSIISYTIEGREYFVVSLDGTGYGNDRKGLIDTDGNMLIRPSYSYINYYDGPYLVCSKKDEPTCVYDINTREIVYRTNSYISRTVDHYLITYTYDVVTQVYHIIDITSGKKLYENTNTMLKECELPTLYPGMGFLIKMEKYTSTARKKTKNLDVFVNLNGHSVESRSIKINEDLKLIFVATERDVTRDGYTMLGTNYGVYDTNLTRIGNFTINSQSLDEFILNSQNDYVILADDITPSVQPGYVFFNATKRTFKTIPGADKAGAFSDGMAIIRNSNELFGYINDMGDIVYNYQFEDADAFNDGQATVVKNYRKLVIDKKGDNREELYQQAAELEAKGDYASAYQIYMGIPDYSDVQEKLNSPEIIYARRQMDYQAGALVKFGNYYGEITWIILEQKDDRVMMISKDVLDFQPYHEYNYNKTVSAVWNASSIKNWLNTEFLEHAFSNAEQDAIINTGIGRVFLLSRNELESHKKFLDEEPKFTQHAAELRQKWNQFIDPTDWLLRNETSTEVLYTRTVYVSSDVHKTAGIRPAIWLPLDSLP